MAGLVRSHMPRASPRQLFRWRGSAGRVVAKNFLPFGEQATILAMSPRAWVALAIGLAACGHPPPPARAPSPLVVRAWAGREPLSTNRAWAAVQFAAAQVGRRYCWGGTGPECFDCTGLVQRAWASVGVRVPRTTGAIASELPRVPVDQVRAGDILWWPGHAGIYAGNGWMVDALDARDGVVRRPAADPPRAYRPE
jgi:cell wall-associated NlpC family hydrolase